MSSNLPIIAFVEMGVYGLTMYWPLSSSGAPRGSRGLPRIRRHAHVLRPRGFVVSGHSNVTMIEPLATVLRSSIFTGTQVSSNWQLPGPMYAATGSMISFEKIHSLLVSTGEFDTGGVRASVSGFALSDGWTLMPSSISSL